MDVPRDYTTFVSSSVADNSSQGTEKSEPSPLKLAACAIHPSFLKPTKVETIQSQTEGSECNATKKLSNSEPMTAAALSTVSNAPFIQPQPDIPNDTFLENQSIGHQETHFSSFIMRFGSDIEIIPFESDDLDPIPEGLAFEDEGRQFPRWYYNNRPFNQPYRSRR